VTTEDVGWLGWWESLGHSFWIFYNRDGGPGQFLSICLADFKKISGMTMKRLLSLKIADVDFDGRLCQSLFWL
jgi:hypothetical protein